MIIETSIKAVRKPRRCEGCGTMIYVGSPAIKWVGVVDGQFMENKYHPDCREAEIKLNEICNTGWMDDWMMLHDIEWENYPWLIENFPTSALRMNITMDKYEEIASSQRRIWQR